jgi:transcriptional regulator with XRE-family HTH domain
MSKEKNPAFNEKRIEELSLSEFFEMERRSRMMTLKDISKETGISVGNLKRIESGEWSKLPAKIYVQNFLSKCANLFELDKSVFLDLYEKEVGFRSYDNERLEKISKKSFIITPKLVTKSVFVVFIAVVLFYFFFQLNYLTGDPKLVVSEPERDIITISKEIIISGQTQRDNKVTINDNEVFVDGEGVFSEVIPLQLGMNSVKIKAVNRLNKESIIIRRIILQE